MGLEWGRIRRNTVVPEVNIFWTPQNSLVVIHNIFLIYSVVVSDICARDYLRQKIFYPQQRQFSFICGIEYINKNFQQQTFKFNSLLKTGLDVFFFFFKEQLDTGWAHQHNNSLHKQWEKAEFFNLDREKTLLHRSRTLAIS